MTVSKITSPISDNEEIDKINEIIDNLGGGGNNKADTDLSNVVSGSFENVVAQAQASGKKTVVGWAMPSSRYNALTIGASGTNYTAPADGWFAAYNANGSNGGVVLANASNGLRITASYQSGFSDGSAFIPCKKGDVVRLNYTGTFGSQYGWFRFIYAQGE